MSGNRKNVENMKAEKGGKRKNNIAVWKTGLKETRSRGNIKSRYKSNEIV